MVECMNVAFLVKFIGHFFRMHHMGGLNETWDVCRYEPKVQNFRQMAKMYSTECFFFFFSLPELLQYDYFMCQDCHTIRSSVSRMLLGSIMIKHRQAESRFMFNESEDQNRTHRCRRSLSPTTVHFTVVKLSQTHCILTMWSMNSFPASVRPAEGMRHLPNQ